MLGSAKEWGRPGTAKSDLAEKYQNCVVKNLIKFTCIQKWLEITKHSPVGMIQIAKRHPKSSWDRSLQIDMQIAKAYSKATAGFSVKNISTKKARFRDYQNLFSIWFWLFIVTLKHSRWHWRLSIADSAQTEYCSTFHCSSVRHRRDISHFSHI